MGETNIKHTSADNIPIKILFCTTVHTLHVYIPEDDSIGKTILTRLWMKCKTYGIDYSRQPGKSSGTS